MFRPIASIFFLVLLMYNTFGYYTFLAYEIDKAKQLHFQELPDDAFVIVKIPVALYTHVEDTDFEFIEDVFSHNGKTYNMVKKRVKNDTLHIYTLRNHRHEQITAQLNTYVKNFFTIEKDTSKSNPVKKIIQAFIKDYIQEQPATFVISSFHNIMSHKATIAPSKKLNNPYLSLTTPPPESV